MFITVKTRQGVYIGVHYAPFLYFPRCLKFSIIKGKKKKSRFNRHLYKIGLCSLSLNYPLRTQQRNEVTE